MLVLAIGLAGCGGGTVEPDEVPGAGPALTVPVDEAISGGTEAAGEEGEAAAGAEDAPAEDSDATDEGTDDSGASATPTPDTLVVGRRHRRWHDRQRDDQRRHHQRRHRHRRRGRRRHRPVDRHAGPDAGRRDERRAAPGRVRRGAVRGLLRAERRRLLTGGAAKAPQPASAGSPSPSAGPGW